MTSSFRSKRFIILAVAVLAGLLVVVVDGVFSNKYDVWLPKQYTLSKAGAGDSSVIDKVSHVSSLEYGKATIYSTSLQGSFYEAKAGKVTLKPSKCPNVFHADSGSPGSDCEKIGAINGSDIYYYDRDLPDENDEAFGIIDGTFIAIQSGYSSKVYTDTFKSLVKVPNNQLDKILATNKAAHDKQTARDDAAADAEKQKEETAYTRLSFNPVLPASLPAGWVSSGQGEIGGSRTPDKPVYVDLGYGPTKGNEDHGLELIQANLTLFRLGPTTCGPTPGANNEYIACSQVAGTDYYEAWNRGKDYENYYLYRPIGNAMAVVKTGVCCDVGKHIDPQDIANQVEFIKSLQTVDKSRLKDLQYDNAGYIFFDGQGVTSQ
jgi:hypothetical protein